MDGVGWCLKDTSALEALQRCSGRLRDMLERGKRNFFFLPYLYASAVQKQTEDNSLQLCSVKDLG